jgi:hypothetical protein
MPLAVLHSRREHVMAFPASEHSCPGCSGEDFPRETCACCGRRAAVAVACEGWRTLTCLETIAAHSVVYCARCWLDLLSMRDHKAPALQAHALTAAGRKLLAAQHAQAERPTPFAHAWIEQQRQRVGHWH